MNLAIQKRKRSELDRPLGFHPRGTPLGFVGLVLLAVGVPFFGLACVASVIPDGLSVWLGSIPYVVAFALLPNFPLVAGLRSHKYWVIPPFGAASRPGKHHGHVLADGARTRCLFSAACTPLAVLAAGQHTPAMETGR